MKSFGFKSMLMASAIALSTIVSPLEAVTQEEMNKIVQNLVNNGVPKKFILDAIRILTTSLLPKLPEFPEVLKNAKSFDLLLQVSVNKNGLNKWTIDSLQNFGAKLSSPAFLELLLALESEVKMGAFLIIEELKSVPQGRFEDPLFLNLLTTYGSGMNPYDLGIYIEKLGKMRQDEFEKLRAICKLSSAPAGSAEEIEIEVPTLPVTASAAAEVETESWGQWIAKKIYSSVESVYSVLPSTSTVATPPAEEATVVRRRGFSPSGNPSDYDAV